MFYVIVFFWLFRNDLNWFLFLQCSKSVIFHKAVDLIFWKPLPLAHKLWQELFMLGCTWSGYAHFYFHSAQKQHCHNSQSLPTSQYWCGKLFIPQKWNIFPQKWNNSPSLSKVCPLSQKWNNSPSLLNVCSLSRIQIWIKFIVKMKQFSLSFEGLSPLSPKGQKEARRAAD